MDRLERKALFIILGIMAFQVWGLTAMLHGAAPARVVRLFSFSAQAWPGWILAMLIAAGYIAITLRRLPYIRARSFDVTVLKLLAVPFSLGAGALEEILFRKVLMDQAANRGWSVLAQVAISALAFGAIHAIFGAFSRSWRGVVLPVVFTGALGAGLAVAYLLAGRDVAPCIWSHAAIDLAIEPWLILSLLRRGQPA